MVFLAAAAAAAEHAAGTPKPGEMFLELFHHVSAHTLFQFNLGGMAVHITNHTILEVIAVFLAFLIFYNVGRLGGRLERPRGAFQNAFESVVLYVRDEMVYKVMPKEHADKLMPLFLTFFIFILFCNLLGLVPLPGVAGVATSNFAVTTALASITLFMIIFGGMYILGPFKFWANIVPHGLPKIMVPLMFVLELLGILIKSFALTLRLFANMIAGHLVILSFFGLVYVLQSYFVLVPAVAMAVFVVLLEVLVAFIQAYVFTFLSIIFISMAICPEH